MKKLFDICFFLFWFGFLIVADFICIRDQNYGMLAYSLLFWVVGIVYAKNRLFRNKRKKKTKQKPGVPFGLIISAGLVLLVIVIGIFLIGLGIKRAEKGLIFMGIFFALGGFAFVLGALGFIGKFDHLEIDIVGLYVGVVFVFIGGGFLEMMYSVTHGILIVIPIIMIFGGICAIIKCLKERK